MVDGRRDLAGVSFVVAVGVFPGDVGEREDGDPADHLTIGAVASSPILLGLRSHKLTA